MVKPDPKVYVSYYYETNDGGSSMDYLIVNERVSLRNQSDLAAVLNYIKSQKDDPAYYTKIILISWQPLDH